MDMVHPEDQTAQHTHSNVVDAVQGSEDGTHLDISQTKETLYIHVDQQRRGRDPAVHPHLKDEGHPSEDNQVHVWAREERWFEGGGEEASLINWETIT